MSDLTAERIIFILKLSLPLITAVAAIAIGLYRDEISFVVLGSGALGIPAMGSVIAGGSNE